MPFQPVIIRPKISIILLAAGQSSRLGKPKQLLTYQGKTLLQHTIDIVVDLPYSTTLVLGAYMEKILASLHLSNITIAVNKNWDEGLASSIRCGLNHVINHNPDTEAIILVLCDQPFLTKEVLSNIVRKYDETQSAIVHSIFKEAFGPPTLFHKSLFPYLMDLKGNQGAKKIVDMFHEKVTHIHFPEGDIDIDTQSDYDLLIKSASDQC